MNSPSPIAVLDGCLFPSQAVQPQAVTAQDTSVESMQDTEGEAGLEVVGMEKYEQETQRQACTGERLVQSSNQTHRPTKEPLSVSPSVHERSWGICFTRLTAAFPQTPNHLAQVSGVDGSCWQVEILVCSVPLRTRRGIESTLAALEATPALTGGLHHPVMVKAEQLVDMPQRPVLHPLPGFTVALVAITSSGTGRCWSCCSLDNNCPWARLLERAQHPCADL